MRVVIAGLSGRTGGAVAAALESAKDVEIVAGIGAQTSGKDVGQILHGRPDGRLVYKDLETAYRATKAQALVDFTVAAVAEKLLLAAFALGVMPVIGTTGLSPDVLADAAERSERFSVPGAVISNFSLGASVLRQIALITQKTFSDFEIIEMHSAHKRDKPSGTALSLRQAMRPDGGDAAPIHSVRLSGLVAHQEILFGGMGEVLTLRHDALGRECYGPGVLRVLAGLPGKHGLFFELDPFLAERVEGVAE